MIRPLLLIIGTISVALGLLGILLPLLPTTPFMLLAASCYARSSERFYNWLIHNRWCGEPIRNYREGRGISLKQKIVTLFFLWLTMGYAILFWCSSGGAKLMLLAVTVAVSLHLLRIKTFKPKLATSTDLQEDCLPETPP